MGTSTALAAPTSLGRYEIRYPRNSPCIELASGGCQLRYSDVLEVLWAAVTLGLPDGSEKRFPWLTTGLRSQLSIENGQEAEAKSVVHRMNLEGANQLIR